MSELTLIVSRTRGSFNLVEFKVENPGSDGRKIIGEFYRIASLFKWKNTVMADDLSSDEGSKNGMELDSTSADTILDGMRSAGVVRAYAAADADGQSLSVGVNLESGMISLSWKTGDLSPESVIKRCIG